MDVAREDREEERKIALNDEREEEEEKEDCEANYLSLKREIKV